MAPKPTAKARRHSEDLLDEALNESFPASDPPSMTEPMVSMRARTRRGVEAKKPAKKKAAKTPARKHAAKKKAVPKTNRAKKTKKRRSK